jgi:ABC-type branched-subunit amino acid transport system substrate-binding protein
MLFRSSLTFACLLVSCSFTQGSVDSCSVDDDCRSAFGVGFVCLESGFCQSAVSEPRCETVWPVDLDENPDDYPDIILLGTIIDDAQVTHVARAKSVELAVRDANESGGVNGREFGLVVCTNTVDPIIDSRNQNEASVAAADFMAQLGVVAIVGPPSSDAAQAVFEEANPGLILVSPSASSDELASLAGPSTDETPGRFWRTTAPDAEQARRIAADIEGRGITQLAIVHADNSYGAGIARIVEATLPAGVTVELFPYATQGRLSEITAEVGRTEAEEILLASSVTSEVTAFLQAAADAPRYDGRSFFLTDAAANRDLVDGITEHPDLFSRIRGTRPQLPDAVTLDAFYARYNLTFGEDVRDLSFTSNAYDAAWISLYAIAWAILQEDGNINPVSVGRGLRQLSSGDEVSIRMSAWMSIIDAFTAGDSVDILGTSGGLDFDASTREISADFVFWGVDPSGIVAL